MKEKQKNARKHVWKLMGILIATVVVAALLAVFVPYGWIGSIILALCVGWITYRKLLFNTMVNVHNELVDKEDRL